MKKKKKKKKPKKFFFYTKVMLRIRMIETFQRIVNQKDENVRMSLLLMCL